MKKGMVLSCVGLLLLVSIVNAGQVALFSDDSSQMVRVFDTVGSLVLYSELYMHGIDYDGYYAEVTYSMPLSAEIGVVNEYVADSEYPDIFRAGLQYVGGTVLLRYMIHANAIDHNFRAQLYQALPLGITIYEMVDAVISDGSTFVHTELEIQKTIGKGFSFHIMGIYDQSGGWSETGLRMGLSFEL